jgi:hypothetical protein
MKPTVGPGSEIALTVALWASDQNKVSVPVRDRSGGIDRVVTHDDERE